MRKAIVTIGVILGVLLVAGSAWALSWNPVDWVKVGAEKGAVAVASMLFTALVAWLGKGRWDAMQLKRAVVEIKLAVDEVRKASDANSPGGNKVTVGEAGKVAEHSLTAILCTLRGINPAWIPHWVDEGTT